MKYCLITTTIIMLLGMGCSQPPHGELLPIPPAGMSEAVKDFFSKEKGIDRDTTYTISGFSVRAFPNDLFLVDVDVNYSIQHRSSNISPPRTPTTGHSTRTCTAQKAISTPDGQTYWQIDMLNAKEAERYKKSIK